MRTILFVLLVAVGAGAVNKVTIPRRFSPGDTIKASYWMENLDSLAAKFNKSVDTQNITIPRFKSFSNHDSTFKWMNIDTIPSADTIKSTSAYFQRSWIDSLKRVKKIDTVKVINALDTIYQIRVIKDIDTIRNLDTANIIGLRGQRAKIDSLKSCDTAKITRAKIVYGYIDTIKNVDSLFAKKAKMTAIVNKVKIDTISNKVKIDTISNRVRIDTISSCDTAYFATIKSGKSFPDSIKSGTGNFFKYDTGSFLCTLRTTSAAVVATGTGKYAKIGGIVCCGLPNLYGSLGVDSSAYVTGYPSIIMPISVKNFAIAVYSNGISLSGYCNLQSSTLSIFISGSQRLSTVGNSGVLSLDMTWNMY